MELTQKYTLWSDSAPYQEGSEPTDIPELSAFYPPSHRDTGCGIVVCPGGGYRILASDHEGFAVAEKLVSMGIAAYVLRYRVAPKYPSTTSLLDGQRAIRLVRRLSGVYARHRLGLLGFSAGGHLAVAVGTARDDLELRTADPIDQESSKPDFIVPIYAVTNGDVRGRKASEYFATDTLVSASTPPTFLVHTHEDSIVSPEQSIIFYRALLEAGVNTELHIFGFGEHGVGLASGDPDVSVWPSLLHSWMRRSGFLTDERRIGVRGRVHPSDFGGMGWVSFTPVNPNYPIARVRVNGANDGEFVIPESHGLVPDPCTMTVTPLSQKPHFDSSGEFTMEGTSHSPRDYDVNITNSGQVELR